MRAGRQALLGVDWGDDCLSLVAVDGHPAQGWRLSLTEQESWLGEPNPSAALARAWRRSASRVRRVAVAVPDHSVWQQVMVLDARLQGEDLHFQIGLRLRDQLPWDISQVSWDYAGQDTQLQAQWQQHLGSGAVVQALALKAEPTLDPQGVADHWWHGEWRWRTQAAGEDKKAQAPARGSTAPLPGQPEAKAGPKR